MKSKYANTCPLLFLHKSTPDDDFRETEDKLSRRSKNWFQRTKYENWNQVDANYHNNERAMAKRIVTGGACVGAETPLWWWSVRNGAASISLKVLGILGWQQQKLSGKCFTESLAFSRFRHHLCICFHVCVCVALWIWSSPWMIYSADVILLDTNLMWHRGKTIWFGRIELWNFLDRNGICWRTMQWKESKHGIKYIEC